jgi:hypothetical protein
MPLPISYPIISYDISICSPYILAFSKHSQHGGPHGASPPASCPENNWQNRPGHGIFVEASWNEKSVDFLGINNHDTYRTRAFKGHSIWVMLFSFTYANLGKFRGTLTDGTPIPMLLPDESPIVWEDYGNGDPIGGRYKFYGQWLL